MPCSIVFILDTSGSMSTRAQPSFSFFDIAKNYIETFIKARSRSDGRAGPFIGRDGDRYFLLTTSSKYPDNVKVLNDKSPIPVLEELKKFPLPYGSNPVCPAILDAFRLMHLNRTMTGIDSYGSGRAPQNTEQVLVILLTDGSGVATIPIDFKLQFEPPLLGSEMTKEAFRWDQKFMSVVFRIPSTPYRPTTSQLNTIDIDVPTIEKLCASTGGRSFSIISVRQINAAIDQALAGLSLHRIGVRFDCLNTMSGKQTSEELLKLRAKFKKVLEKRPVTNIVSRITPQGRPVPCHWQIPENFFPVKNMDILPPRLAHPLILVGTEAIPMMIRNDVLHDKYEVEMCGVSEIVLEMLKGQKDHIVPTFISNSSNNGSNVPFGCLRLNTFGNGLNLILLPFNFPVLYQLIDEIKDPSMIVNPQWRSRLDAYLQSVPFYYLTPIRQTLDKLKVKVEVSSSMSSTYAPSLLNNLNRLKTKGKEEYDSVGLSAKLGESRGVRSFNPMIRVERITSRTAMSGLIDGEEGEETDPVELMPIYSGDFHIPLYPPLVNEPELDTIYRTPWSCPIDEMIKKLNKMQANVELIFDPAKSTLLDMAKMGTKPTFNNLEELHNLPLKMMGEYEPYQAARIKYYGTPFKKIEEEKERTHAFGNPYKLKSLDDDVLDSAIVDTQEGKKGAGINNVGNGKRGGKRKGPLGVDAFDKWRTRRSMIGSDRDGSIISTNEMDVDEPSTSNGSEENVNEIENENEMNKLVEMLEDEGKTTSTSSSSKFVAPPLPLQNGKVFGRNGVLNKKEEIQEENEEEKGNCLTNEEILEKKKEIGRIVRRPMNAKAFEDILRMTNGITNYFVEMLIKHAVREARRFKQKMLAEKLEKLLEI